MTSELKRRVQASKRPFKFVHDITYIYFTFTAPSWFYPSDSYSDEMTKRSGYKFDGQIFFKRLK